MDRFPRSELHRPVLLEFLGFWYVFVHYWGASVPLQKRDGQVFVWYFPHRRRVQCFGAPTLITITDERNSFLEGVPASSHVRRGAIHGGRRGAPTSHPDGTSHTTPSSVTAGGRVDPHPDLPSDRMGRPDATFS